jgi:diguanylate cyclase (GGDEF)-like protein
MSALPRRLKLYVAAVCLAGTLLAAVLAVADDGRLAEHLSPAVVVLVLLALVGEFVPIRVFRRGAEGDLTVSTAFAFALLLDAGPATAAAALVLATIASDLHGRKDAVRIWFNVAQYCVSLTAAWIVLGALTDVPHAGGAPFMPGDLPGIMASALAFFLTNALLVAIVVALAQGFSVRAYLNEDLIFVAGAAGMALGLAPLAVLAAEFSVLLVAALGLPLVGVYRAARQALELEHHSRHDALTGLPNRLMLRLRLDSALRTASEDEGAGATVMLLDLDHFKEINDTLGHLHGDLLLREAAERLRGAVRADDLVARLGGDEFAVVLGGADDAPRAVDLGRRLLAELARPIEVEGVTLRVEGSIGIARWPEHGEDTETLLRHADIAMYVAKGGRTGVELYDPEQERHSPARLSLAGELRDALDHGQLEVYFQPQADLRTGAVRGVEALVRWHHPAHGLLRPDEFVPVAENTGLIGPLTLHVLDRSLAQIAAWDAQDLHLEVAVNLSTRNLLDRELPARIAELLAFHGLPAARLEVEITESMVSSDPQRVHAVLCAIAGLGVRITLDDFGTGYSSLSNLRDLPVRRLKIDRSFIAGMARRRADAVIVTSTIEMAQRLGLSVVAEGVETAEAWARLRESGCDLAQGHHLTPPCPAAELTAWMAARRERAGRRALRGVA